MARKIPSRAKRRQAAGRMLPSKTLEAKMRRLVARVLTRTQTRILQITDKRLHDVAQTEGFTTEHVTSLWRGDGRTALSMDLDLARVELLRDLQAKPAGTPTDITNVSQAKIDKSGMRDESLTLVRNQRARRDPNARRPVVIEVHPKEGAIVTDGRHRIQVAREVGDTSINAIIRYYDTDGNVIREIQKDLSLAASLPVINLESELTKIAQSAASINAKALTEILGINVRAASGLGTNIDSFRERNVLLIRSLVDKQITDVQTMLEESENQGLRVEEIRAKIQQEFGVSKSKADLLARDQVLKLNGQITMARQRLAGVSKYVWTTSGDERVRESHAELEGKVFSWDAPPDVGHPGDDYQCRCTAFPLIEEFDGEEAL